MRQGFILAARDAAANPQDDGFPDFPNLQDDGFPAAKRGGRRSRSSSGSSRSSSKRVSRRESRAHQPVAQAEEEEAEAEEIIGDEGGGDAASAPRAAAPPCAPPQLPEHSSAREHAARIFNLGVPRVVGMLYGFAPRLVFLGRLGRLPNGPLNLAAAGMSTMWVNVTYNSFLMATSFGVQGVLAQVDPI